jgi:hypothetical protein
MRFAFTYRTIIIVVAVTFAFPKRETVSWGTTVAHQNECINLFRFDAGFEIGVRASWNRQVCGGFEAIQTPLNSKREVER